MARICYSGLDVLMPLNSKKHFREFHPLWDYKTKTNTPESEKKFFSSCVTYECAKSGKKSISQIISLRKFEMF